jgi:hypothetical protein
MITELVYEYRPLSPLTGIGFVMVRVTITSTLPPPPIQYQKTHGTALSLLIPLPTSPTDQKWDCILMVLNALTQEMEAGLLVK